jgi:hypothetical protein
MHDVEPAREEAALASVDGPSPPTPGASIENGRLADLLERVADLLAAQDASAFRERAYRHAAYELRRLQQPARDIFVARGTAGLEEIHAIGPSISSALAEYFETGRLRVLERLEGQTAPEDLFASLPGIGPELSRRIHHELGVDTLEELELAAYDGRLSRLHGFGIRRVKSLRDLLAARSRRRRSPRQTAMASAPASAARGVGEPGVPLLLALDAEYRDKAARRALRMIAPRRFNPAHEAWLPIWHTERDGWHVTALFSNTALAHRVGATHDWVVIYCERGGQESLATVVTERRGALAGRRVVRGREHECELYQEARERDGRAPMP